MLKITSRFNANIIVLVFLLNSLAFGSSHAQAATNDLSAVGSASNAVSKLLNGANGIALVPGSESTFGTVKDFTDIDLGGGISLNRPGIFLTSGTAAGADNSGASSILRSQLSNILAQAGIVEDGSNVTNVSSLTFQFTTTSSSIKSVDLNFIFASNEIHTQEWDIAAVIVDGVNYAKLSNGKIWRVDPNANLMDLSAGFSDPTSPNYNIDAGLWEQNVPIQFSGNRVYSAAPAGRIVGLLDQSLTTHTITIAVGDTQDQIVPSYLFISLINGSLDTIGGIQNNAKAPSNVIAKALTAKNVAVSFDPPTITDGIKVTSYIATLNPGYYTQTLNQSGSGSFQFNGLNQLTTYTATISAVYADGTTTSTLSNSVTTPGNVPASISSLTFADDGTGTGGKIVWTGKNIDAVLFTGPEIAYPGPFNYGAFTSGWNGRIRNLTPGTEYTVSIFAVSADGAGESKSFTFKTSATLPALAGATSATISRTDEMTTQLPKLFAWINENVFVEGEGDRMKMMLNKFDALVTSPHRSYIKVPTSRVLSVVATSLTPLTCSVVSATARENAGLVKALSGDTCTVSYTVSGASKAPVTLVRDFTFTKFSV